MLEVAYDNGGSLLKFGGDALLLWFHDDAHVARACRAAVMMRRVLREVGRIEVPGAKVTLRMAQGVHSGEFHFFAAGTSHVELLATGPRGVASSRWSTGRRWTDCRQSGNGGAAAGPECLGEPKAPGRPASAGAAGSREKLPLIPRPKLAPEDGPALPVASVRAHVRGGGGTTEHRPVTVAFIRFEDIDALIERDGLAVAADALQRPIGRCRGRPPRHRTSRSSVPTWIPTAAN